MISYSRTLIFILLQFIIYPKLFFTQNIKLDLDRVPFSVSGAYFSISTLNNRIPQDTLYINHFLGLDTRQVFKILPFDKDQNTLQYSIEALPWQIALHSEISELNICFENPKIIRMEGNNSGFKLSSELIMYPIPMPNKNQYRILGKNRYDRFMITCLKGSIDIVKDNSGYEIIVSPEDSYCEIAIEEYISEWVPREYNKSFDECSASTKNEFETFISKSPKVDSKYEDAKNLALYINWSSIVYPRGLMNRPGMLMSKNWMNYIWSWDNCFNAIGMASNYPYLAWDQVMVVLENQDELGILPDRFRDVFIHYGFTKPPVYGYTLNQLEKIKDFMNKERYEEVYSYLTKLTDFWLTYRDDNNNMLPEYHHGNDSGWDNATVFDIGFPIEGPDLSSFLIIQMDKLSEIAAKIGLENQSRGWKLKADDLFKKMMNEFLKDDKFIYKNSVTGEYVENSNSLLPYIPISLGQRLPKSLQIKLINDLKKSGILTEFGPATENPSSQKYTYDGYWRGPIWAPSTFIIVEGLYECGEEDLAKELAQRFCNLCSQSGFAENYDAISGTPLRDKAYTWTASIFLFFLNKYL